MGIHQPIRKTVTPEIPDKLYFRIGDVARLCEVPAYVLRFWETEFPQLKPNKGGTGQRLYRKRDVEMALRIKSLLYDQGYTIPGARQVFKSEARVKDLSPAVPSDDLAPRSLAEKSSRPLAPGTETHVESDTARLAKLQTLRHEMQGLLDVLSAPAGARSFSAPPSARPPAPRLQTLRPRLVSDASAAAPSLKLASSRPALRSGLTGRSEDQPDLFPPLSAPSE